MEKEDKIKEIGDSLIISNEGMSCDEFTTLITAGPPRKEMPPSVRERMNQHEDACSYHQSKAFHQSALDIFVTKEAEQAARDIIKKYRKLGESKSVKG